MPVQVIPTFNPSTVTQTKHTLKVDLDPMTNIS